MPESGTSGSVRGARGNSRPYRERATVLIVAGQSGAAGPGGGPATGAGLGGGAPRGAAAERDAGPQRSRKRIHFCS